MIIKEFFGVMKEALIKLFSESSRDLSRPKNFFYLMFFIILILWIRGDPIHLSLIILFTLALLRYIWSAFYGEYRHREKERQKENPPMI